MKAVLQERYGSPEDVLVLKDVAEPSPGPKQVLVEVAAASVNAGDAALTRGIPYVVRLGSGLRRPRKGLRGSDISGVVAAVGPGVTGFSPGDEVFGKGEGAFAEMVVAHHERVVPKPEGITFEQAASLPVAGLTAVQGLRDVADVQPGQRVLVVGASGGVGTFAVQVANALGAEVTAVCSTHNVETIRSLGADHVIDYTKEDFLDTEALFDVVFDNAASRSFSETRGVMVRGGVLIPNSGNLQSRWLASLPTMMKAVVTSPFVDQRIKLNVQTWSQDDLSEMGRLVESGGVSPVIERTYSLPETGTAVEYVARGHARGKVLIVI